MAVERITLGGENGLPIDLDLLPMFFGVTIPALGIPLPDPPPLILSAESFGVQVEFICPGFPACGKEPLEGEDEAVACRQTKTSPIINLADYLPVIDITIPQIGIPEQVVGVTVPSSGWNPLNCPMYNKKSTT